MPQMYKVGDGRYYRFDHRSPLASALDRSYEFKLAGSEHLLQVIKGSFVTGSLKPKTVRFQGSIHQAVTWFGIVLLDYSKTMSQCFTADANNLSHYAVPYGNWSQMVNYVRKVIEYEDGTVIHIIVRLVYATSSNQIIRLDAFDISEHDIISVDYYPPEEKKQIMSDRSYIQTSTDEGATWRYYCEITPTYTKHNAISDMPVGTVFRVVEERNGEVIKTVSDCIVSRKPIGCGGVTGITLTSPGGGCGSSQPPGITITVQEDATMSSNPTVEDFLSRFATSSEHRKVKQVTFKYKDGKPCGDIEVHFVTY